MRSGTALLAATMPALAAPAVAQPVGGFCVGAGAGLTWLQDQSSSPFGFGFDRPLVPTAAGVREPQNRRVEIVLR
jgi:hypothetical protein